MKRADLLRFGRFLAAVPACVLSVLIVASIFAHPLAQQTPNSLASATHGTIVVFVPTKEGMIIAADSREDVKGLGYCDGIDKVFPLKNHPRSIIAVTGSHSVTISPVSATDACSFIRNANNAAHKVDFRRIGKSFLDSRQGPVTKATMQALESVLTARIDKLLPTYPNLIEPDGGILNFSFAQYLPEQSVIVYSEFRIAPTAEKKSTIKEETFNPIQLTDDLLQNTHVAGAGDCLIKANSPEGRSRLGPSYFQTLDQLQRRKPTVGQTNREDGLALARDLINSTIKYSDMFPNANCRVGGPLKIYRLDAHP